MKDYNVMKYEGAEATFSGLKEYLEDFSLASTHATETGSEDAFAWLTSEDFMVLIHRKTRKVVGLRLSGLDTLRREEIMNPRNFLFVTDYVPVHIELVSVSSAFDLQIKAEGVLFFFEMELERISAAGNMPLFLVSNQSMRYNANYNAWSLAEEKYVTVHGYRKERLNFGVSEYGAADSSPIILNNRYSIIPPSRALIKSLRLPLCAGFLHDNLKRG